MIDFHSHILPDFDDGSKSIEMTYKMLTLEKEQGVDLVVSTSHFYATDESIDDFCRRRSAAYSKIEQSPSLPKIVIGAEVAFFFGLASTDLSKLCIGNTNLILIEMPFDKWSAATLSEINKIQMGGYSPILAHTERFLHYGNEKYIKALKNEGVILQSNAEFFIDKKTSKKAIKMLKKGLIDVVGSDCHNLDSRPPDMGLLSSVLKKEQLEDINSRSYSLLQNGYIK